MTNMLKNIYHQVMNPRLFAARKKNVLFREPDYFENTSELTVECPSGTVEVFLVYAFFCPRRTGYASEELAACLRRTDFDLDRMKVFLSKQEARDYLRFMDDTHRILHAFVPDQAIEGRSHELGLKKDYFNYHFIHGCYSSARQDNSYLKNRDFLLPVMT